MASSRGIINGALSKIRGDVETPCSVFCQGTSGAKKRPSPYIYALLNMAWPVSHVFYHTVVSRVLLVSLAHVELIIAQNIDLSTPCHCPCPRSTFRPQPHETEDTASRRRLIAIAKLDRVNDVINGVRRALISPCFGSSIEDDVRRPRETPRDVP